VPLEFLSIKGRWDAKASQTNPINIKIPKTDIFEPIEEIEFQ